MIGIPVTAPTTQARRSGRPRSQEAVWRRQLTSRTWCGHERAPARTSSMMRESVWVIESAGSRRGASVTLLVRFFHPLAEQE